MAKTLSRQGVDGLDEKKPVVDVVWNEIPAVHRNAIIDLELAEPQLSPRKLAVTYTDDKAG